MLRIKFFEEFKNDLPFVVIISDKEGFAAAYNFLKDREEAFLTNQEITEFSDISPLAEDALYLNREECQELARHFKNLSESDEPSHIYFDIEALGNDIEIIASFKEYESLF